MLCAEYEDEIDLDALILNNSESGLQSHLLFYIPLVHLLKYLYQVPENK